MNNIGFQPTVQFSARTQAKQPHFGFATNDDSPDGSFDEPPEYNDPLDPEGVDAFMAGDFDFLDASADIDLHEPQKRQPLPVDNPALTANRRAFVLDSPSSRLAGPHFKTVG